MPFNSIEFLFFLPVVFVIYWFVTNKTLRWQNIWIFLSSLIFYSFTDWRLSGILILSILVNYFIAITISKFNGHLKKLMLWLAVSFNIGMLFGFKYMGFFISSFIKGFDFLGFDISSPTLFVIIPVGISFFTFQALGYVIDVYRKNTEVTRDIIAFGSFVSFFPLILAGPIERANNLLLQLKTKRVFEYTLATDGLKQILWGLFKKLVIADNCSSMVNTVFSHGEAYSSSTLLMAAFLFAIQIYADFSGYSDMAIGVSKLLGFDIKKNFRFPYFAISIADFWRRWHISLSSWLRDYLYNRLSIKLRRWGIAATVFSLLITFLLCGMWHGPNFTFIIWGGLHGLALVWDILTAKHRIKIKKRIKPAVYIIFSRAITFLFLCFTWIIFKSDNFHSAVSYISRIFTRTIFQFPSFPEMNNPFLILFFILIFGLAEWFGKEKEYALKDMGLKWKRPLRWAVYFFIVFIIGMYMRSEEMPFIYFKF